MSRPWQDFPPRRPSPYHFVSDPAEIYAGPEEYMEVGTRGFLVNILLGKEEIGLDDALDLLRQAAIKLYGGIKPKSKKTDVSRGYVKIDFMDPESVTILPFPEGEEDVEIEPDQAKDAAKTDDAGHDKQNGNNKTEQGAAKVIKNEKEGLEDSKKKKEDVNEKLGASKTGKTTVTTSDEKQKNKAEGGVSEAEKITDASQDKKEEPKKEEQWMKSSYKFKAFRTEIKNLMFVKSNVPDPVIVADTAMEIVLARKTLNGDAIRQLLPVLGVCQNDYHRLEVMARCVLAPLFAESLEPKSFSVFLMDKLSAPGADMLIETVRNVIWSINPSSWQSSPLTEPDIVIRLEIIGRKLVLNCLTHFMRFRHYNPKVLVESGLGEPEDDDGTWVPSEVRKMQEIIRAEREKRRELERQREEEHRKEREKRREEAEARRRERIKEEKEREERRQKEREKEREKEKEKHSKAEKKDDTKANEKEEGNKKTEDSKDKEVKPKDSQSTEQKSDEKSDEQKDAKKVQMKRFSNAESPPTKKAKVEETNSAKDEAEMEEAVDDSDEDDDDKKGSPKKGGKAKRGGRKKTKK